jgi:hypothetical protein
MAKRLPVPSIRYRTGGERRVADSTLTCGVNGDRCEERQPEHGRREGVLQLEGERRAVEDGSG